MPRSARSLVNGMVYHVLNRGNGQQQLFYDANDYTFFKELLYGAKARFGLFVYAYSIMPNHFHLAIKSGQSDGISRAMQWIMTRHVLYHQEVYNTCGHIWQGRFKSFAVSTHSYLINLLRYIEANPVRAGLVKCCTEWRWSSYGERKHDKAGLIDYIIDLPEPWMEFVNQPLDNECLTKIRISVKRQTPYGSKNWVENVVKTLGLESTIRPVGRPNKKLMDK